jgi:hypothetical protein
MIPCEAISSKASSASMGRRASGSLAGLIAISAFIEMVSFLQSKAKYDLPIPFPSTVSSGPETTLAPSICRLTRWVTAPASDTYLDKLLANPSAHRDSSRPELVFNSVLKPASGRPASLSGHMIVGSHRTVRLPPSLIPIVCRIVPVHGEDGIRPSIRSTVGHLGGSLANESPLRSSRGALRRARRLCRGVGWIGKRRVKGGRFVEDSKSKM